MRKFRVIKSELSPTGIRHLKTKELLNAMCLAEALTYISGLFKPHEVDFRKNTTVTIHASYEIFRMDRPNSIVGWVVEDK